MLIATNGMIGLYYQIAEFGPPSSDTFVRYQKIKIAAGLFAVWVLLLLIQLLEKSYRDKIVHQVYRMLCGEKGAATNTSAKSNAKSSANPTGDTNNYNNSKSNSLGGREMEMIHNALNDTDDDRTLSDAAQASETGNSTAPNEPMNYSYFVRTYSRSSVASSSLTMIKGQMFNKRIFTLKVVVALLHLFSYQYGVQLENFVVVNAVLAITPNLIEVIVDVADLYYRLLYVDRELAMQATKERLASSCADDADVEVETGGGPHNMISASNNSVTSTSPKSFSYGVTTPLPNNVK